MKKMMQKEDGKQFEMGFELEIGLMMMMKEIVPSMSLVLIVFVVELLENVLMMNFLNHLVATTGVMKMMEIVQLICLNLFGFVAEFLGIDQVRIVLDYYFVVDWLVEMLMETFPLMFLHSYCFVDELSENDQGMEFLNCLFVVVLVFAAMKMMMENVPNVVLNLHVMAAALLETGPVKTFPSYYFVIELDFDLIEKMMEIDQVKTSLSYYFVIDLGLSVAEMLVND